MKTSNIEPVEAADPNILTGFAAETEFTAANGISQKTCKRYREMGLPFTHFGGRVYIHLDGARAWLDSRIRNANPPRKRSKAGA